MTMRIKTAKISVDGLNVFYREAGPVDAPTILLLHGYPTSSFMFRNLIPELAAHYHVIAPDLPGFGFTDMPLRANFTYSFEHLTDVIERFTEVVGLKSYALYVFDYGAPVGWRLAKRHPERITALITQNGNAYAEGLSDNWNPIRAYWEAPTRENREILRNFLVPEMAIFQYTHGVANPADVAPEGYTLDNALLARPESDEIQLDLMLDYESNVVAYDGFHAYFREFQPPLLAVWGDKDPFFIAAGAEAFRRDLPKADIRFFDTGHFALETHAVEIGAAIVTFLDRTVG